ncbi:death domain-associated protein 6 [Mantella aurantiaca]
MASVVDIIVLDDDGDDEERPSCSPEAKKSPSEPPPPSEPQSNEKKDGGSSQNKASMSAENQKLFEEFVEYCSKVTTEHPEVIAFLQSRFSKANATYLSSVEFRNTLGRCLTRVQSKQTKVYVYINELCTVLKNHSEKKKVSLQSKPAAPQRDKVETDKTRDNFPDYRDILQEVQKANERHNLGLTRKNVQSISQDAFRDLGNKLQYRRHLDMVYNFGSHLTDTYKNGLDPADHDTTLARRLRDNRSLAETRLEDVIKKFVEKQDEGDEEDWKNKEQDDEMPSTSKGLKDSPRSRKTESSKSDESEEEEDEDEESEESDVDIEEELRQSQEAADGDEDEEIPAEYSNETDQKMEETSDPQSSSPAGKEEGENAESDNSDQDADEVEEGTDKDEDQDLYSASTSLSPEKEDLNTRLEIEMEKAESATSGDSNDSQPDNKTQEEHADHVEQDKSSVCSGVTSCDEADSRDGPLEHLEMTVVEEEFVGNGENNTEVVNVPYVKAEMPSSEEQGTSKCTDTKTDVEKDSKSPMIKGKDGKFSRLDKCISKLTGSLSHKVATGTEDDGISHVNNKNLGSGGISRTKKQSRKLVCVDTPAERWDSVRKIAFSHRQSADENSDVVHLDGSRNGTRSESSNGVHRDVVRTSTPINRLKRKRDPTTPTEPVFNVKVEDLGTNRRKRKATSQLWTGNGVTKYNGEENGTQQKLKRPKLNSSYTSYSSPSEPCSDNEHDITLDLMVTCSPQMTPTKTPSPQHKTDAATQCDPDEVIVLSD